MNGKSYLYTVTILSANDDATAAAQRGLEAAVQPYRACIARALVANQGRGLGKREQAFTLCGEQQRVEDDKYEKLGEEAEQAAKNAIAGT